MNRYLDLSKEENRRKLMNEEPDLDLTQSTGSEPIVFVKEYLMKKLLVLCFLLIPVFASAQICGNDILEEPEECDDGNLVIGDGCSELCLIEHPATHDELKGILGNQALKDKVHIAILIVVDKIIQGEDIGPSFDVGNHDNRIVWARRIISNTAGALDTAAQIFPIIIISNRALAIGVILNASDSAIQAKVDGIVDLFAIGE